jgi:hypothetical protein
MLKNTPIFWSIALSLSLALIGQGAVCSETLTIYDTEADFLRDAPFVSTEGFDDFPNTFFDTAEVTFDEVRYMIHNDYGPGDCEGGGWTCWQVWTIREPVSPPNVLWSYANMHGSLGGEEWEALSFGEGKVAKAIGFYTAGGLKDDSGRWWTHVRVRENGGNETSFYVFAWDQDSRADEFLYIGLISQTGIIEVETRPESPAGDLLSTTVRLFDDVSRSEVRSAQLYASIDIKPGNGRNVINPRSKGRFWAAMLSDEDFDALQIDPATVALGPAEALPDRYRVKDVNRDRLPDLMLRFRTPEVGLQCGDTEVGLTGETYAGESIIGTDKVKTVGCKKKPKKGKKK